MEEAEKFRTRPPAGDPVERARKNEEQFQAEVKRRARATGRPVEEVEHELATEVQGHPYRVREENLPGAPFFRVTQIGGQRALYLNTAHRFFTDVYAGPESTPRLRAALELLLFVLGESELDATADRSLFYQNERAWWSGRLMTLLDKLDQIDAKSDLTTLAEQQREDS